VAALASVTARTGQFVLAVLAMVLFLFVVEVLSQLVPNASVETESPQKLLSLAFLIGACFVVVFWQYSRRRTTQSRLVFIGVAAAILFIMVATPYRLLIQRAYPEETAGHQLPVQLTFDPAKPTPQENPSWAEKKKVLVRIPLLVSGVPSGSMVREYGTKVSISAPGGHEWTSDWWDGGSVTLYPGRPRSEIFISLDRGFFDQVKLTPAKVRISFALTLFQRKGAKRIVAEAGGFSVPGEGRCIFGPLYSDRVTCSFPLKSQDLFVSARSEEMTCPPRQLVPPSRMLERTPFPSDTIGYGNIVSITLPLIAGSLLGPAWRWASSPAEFGLTPVVYEDLFLFGWNGDALPTPVCPGTPLTISTLEQSQRARRELEIDGVRFADYQLKDSAD
jgi:hypothetical protein